MSIYDMLLLLCYLTIIPYGICCWKDLKDDEKFQS